MNSRHHSRCTALLHPPGSFRSSHNQPSNLPTFKCGSCVPQASSRRSSRILFRMNTCETLYEAVHSKGFTESLSPLESTLTKKRGEASPQFQGLFSLRSVLSVCLCVSSFFSSNRRLLALAISFVFLYLTTGSKLAHAFSQ